MTSILRPTFPAPKTEYAKIVIPYSELKRARILRSIGEALETDIAEAVSEWLTVKADERPPLGNPIKFPTDCLSRGPWIPMLTPLETGSAA